MLKFSTQTINNYDIKAVSKALKSEYLTQGPKTSEFEKKIKNYTGAKYCVAVNSASSALLISCLSLQLRKNDINEVYGYIIDEMAAKFSRIDIFSEMCVYFDIKPVKFYSSLSNVYKEDLIQELDLRTGILEKKNIKKLF